MNSRKHHHLATWAVVFLFWNTVAWGFDDGKGFPPSRRSATTNGSATAGYVLTDGGSTMTGPLVTDKVVSRPGHNLIVQAPDGGVQVITNGVVIVEFRRDGVVQLKSSMTYLEPQGDLTVQLPDGGLLLTGALIADKAVSRPGHNLVLQAPDGGVDIKTNGATIVSFRRDGVTQLLASATVLEPQGDLTLQTPDGGFIVEGKFLINKASGSGTILEPKGNLSILAPDGGITVGPNKFTSQGAIADATERCMIPFYSAVAGTGLSSSIQTWHQMQYAGPITVTAVIGRYVAAGTGTADWRVSDGLGNTCECVHTCATNGSNRDACVNGLGAGCVFPASAALNVIWAQDRDGGLDACTTSQPSLVGACVVGKNQ